nr:reverse transcriptase domain-containing protein [Tanacetum cinerariifolium]
MANTTLIMTTVMKAANKEKTPKEVDVALKVNILDFCEDHYEDIFPVIMDKIRRDKQKEVHVRLDFEESPKKCRRGREGSQNSSVGTLPARPGMVNSKDRSHSRGRPRIRGSSPRRDHPRSRDCLCGIEESYGTARVWFDELPSESIDGYKDLKAAFLAYFMQQKKYVKDPVKIHNIKQRDGETIEDFIERFKTTKEMRTATTAFIQGETAIASKKKGHTSWKPQDQPKRHVSERRFDFRGKFKPPPPMVTLVEKRSSNKFCDFHNDKGNNTDECVQLKKQIEELVRAGKLSHLIKEIKQGRDQPKVGKREVLAKDKYTAIYMVQLWHRMTRQKVTQSFACVREITFPPLATSRGTEGRLVIEAKIGRHMIHRMKDIRLYDRRKGVRPRNVPGPSKYRWHNRMKRKRLSTPATEYIAIPKCLSVSRTLAPQTSGWWTQLLTAKLLRTSVKGEILADFLVEKPDEAPPDTSVVETTQEPPKKQKKKADTLSKIASTSFTHLSKQVLVEVLIEKSIQEKEVVTVVEEDGPIWMTPIMEYLKDRTLPDDRKEANKLRIKARRYELLEGVLYRRSFLKLWLRCVGPLQEDYVIREIHEGSCSMHAGPRKGKVFDSRYRLLYEVDRGESRGDNHQYSDEEVRVGQHSVPLRPSGRNSFGQRTEAVIPAEIIISTYRTTVVDAMYNDEELRLNLDLLEERREHAAIHEAKSKLKMTKYYNVRVRGVTFRPGDFVYRSNDASHDVDRGSLVQNEKDLMRSRKHLETERTC